MKFEERVAFKRDEQAATDAERPYFGHVRSLTFAEQLRSHCNLYRLHGVGHKKCRALFLVALGNRLQRRDLRSAPLVSLLVERGLVVLEGDELVATDKLRYECAVIKEAPEPKSEGPIGLADLILAQLDD